MKTFIADFVIFIFLFAFIILISIAASASLWIGIISFGGIYILWQIVKRVIIWSDPSIKDEIE